MRTGHPHPSHLPDREREQEYDFANILFAGPCNQRCPTCIGHLIDPTLNEDNLQRFPLRNQRRFAALLRRYGVRQIVFTGTTTDPQLYQHEARLIGWFRQHVPGAQISLHTNGQLALNRTEVFHLYARATISYPSFDPDTFARISGTRRMPDLAAIVRTAHIPVKVSCLIGEENGDQVPELLARCHEIGVRRLVLRRQVLSRQDSSSDWQLPLSLTAIPGCTWRGVYRNNPVYDYRGMEVTCWDFCHTTSTALNLFSDGTISSAYRLTRAPAIRASIHARFTAVSRYLNRQKGGDVL
jgi:hypothetical protein